MRASQARKQVNGTAETLATTAHVQLREDIIHARFKPGEKLRVRHLCALYGMGLSPVREALNRASREGLVQQTDLRGFSVLPLSEEELEELTQTRCWLNEIAVRRSIERGDDAWEENVVLAYHRFSKTPRHSKDQPGTRNRDWERAHRAFHSSIIAACGSRWLLAYCEQLFDIADRYRFLWSMPGAERERLSERAHREIMEATVARDADRAILLLNQHFTRAAALAAAKLRENKAALKQSRPRKGKRIVARPSPPPRRKTG